VIKSFRHKGIESYFKDGSKAGYPAETCREATESAFCTRQRKASAGHERSRLEITPLARWFGRPLVGRRKRELASYIRLWGRRCHFDWLSGLSL